MNEFLIFGFRPNLSCMPVQARGYTYQSNGDKQSVTAYESIATDVTLNSNMLTRNLHFLELGLWNAHFLWFILDSGKMMGQYIHAALAIGRDSTPMILELLRTLHSGRHPWNSDINRVCRTVSDKVVHHVASTLLSDDYIVLFDLLHRDYVF